MPAEAKNNHDTGPAIIPPEFAYRGVTGKKRAAFCQDYLARKQEVLAEIRLSQQQAVAGRGEAISCRPGCSLCCLAYMQASIPECEAIAYYLYRHEAALRTFMANYPAWREGLRRRGDLFKECGRLWEASSQPGAGETERTALSMAEKRYQEQGLYCPFLVENACAIYEARPLTCAALVASTPYAWCHPASASQAKTYVTSTPAMLANSFYFGRIEGNVLAFMPLTVYRILRDGYSFLERIPGLAGLREAAGRQAGRKGNGLGTP
jgi:Fe-S-cluster containining protein